MPDKERKFGNLTLTYATQIHACVVEVDPETGVYEIVDYAAVDDCGNRIHPQIVEGQVHGATAHALGAATHEIFTYDEDGQPADAELLRLPRAARARHAADEERLHRVAVAVHAARREGHGGGRRRRHPRRLRRAAERARRRGEGPIVWRQLQPVPPRVGAAAEARASRAKLVAWRADEGQRGATVRRAAARPSGRCSTTRRGWRRRCPASSRSTSRTTRTGGPT